jgi:hypothetical protein
MAIWSLNELPNPSSTEKIMLHNNMNRANDYMISQNEPDILNSLHMGSSYAKLDNKTGTTAERNWLKTGRQMSPQLSVGADFIVNSYNLLYN